MHLGSFHLSYASEGENTTKAEGLAKSLGLSYLTNAAKGNVSRKASDKNWTQDGLFDIEQEIKRGTVNSTDQAVPKMLFGI